MKDVATISFSYEGIDSKSELIALAGYVKKEKAAGLDAMLKMGEHLAEAQSLLSNQGDGTFGKWIEAECWVSKRSAFSYLNAYKALGKDSAGSALSFTLEAILALTSKDAPPEALKEAKKRAAKGEKINAKVVKEIREKAEPKPESEPEPEREEASETVLEWPPILDSLKRVVPESLHEVFGAVDEIKALMRDISAIKSRCIALCETKVGKGLDQQELERLLTNARTELTFRMPYTECPKCRRKLEKKCPACFGRGWISKSTFNDSVCDADNQWLTKTA